LFAATFGLITFAKIFTMVRFFKIIATLEGISLLVLLFFAYVHRVEHLVRIIGMAHGVLFIIYSALATVLKFKQGWSWGKYAIIFLASFVPLGTFYIEWKYFRSSQNN
jgi:integral membrane protein